jgi:hypothetical protein
MAKIQPLPDRSAEQPAEARPRHEVQAVLILTAKVPENVTATHLAQYAAGLFNGEDDLPEDIRDELTCTQICGTTNPVRGSVLDCAVAAGTRAMAAQMAAREARCAHCADTGAIDMPGGAEPCAACK